VSCWSDSEATIPASQKKLVNWTLAWQVYPVAAPGAPQDVFRKTLTDDPMHPPPSLSVVWTDTAGRAVLGYWGKSNGNASQFKQGFGAVSADGRFQDLPLPAQNVGTGTVKGIAW
jgi:hypothetical protein